MPSIRTFQSTPPVRGATICRICSGYRPCDFNPRPPCGERREDTLATDREDWISIHAPRAGSDTVKDRLPEVYKISIHAPRAGSDRENSDHYSDFQIILVWLFVSGRIWLLILNISQSI